MALGTGLVSDGIAFTTQPFRRSSGGPVAAGASGGGGGGFGRAAPKRFEPVPGAHVMARFSNGEFYKARVTAMSRSESGAPVCVVKFEEDGLVLHVPVEHVRPQHGAARA